MIGLYEFAALTFEERMLYVVNHSTFIANVKTDVKGYSLYHYNDYFIEVELAFQNDQTYITDAVPFVRGERIEKYLPQIDLSDWINGR